MSGGAHPIEERKAKKLRGVAQQKLEGVTKKKISSTHYKDRVDTRE